MNACFIDEMVVENPHDAVQEFIERYRKNTPFENGSSPNTRYAQPKSDDEVVHARSRLSAYNDPKRHLILPQNRKEWAVQWNKCGQH